MYRWTRTARVSKGRFPQAIGWGKEIAASVVKKHKAPEVRLYMTAIGDIAELSWEVDYPDLATFERIQGAILTDQEYWQQIARANTEELFIDGETRDTLRKLL